MASVGANLTVAVTRLLENATWQARLWNTIMPWNSLFFQAASSRNTRKVSLPLEGCWDNTDFTATNKGLLPAEYLPIRTLRLKYPLKSWSLGSTACSREESGLGIPQKWLAQIRLTFSALPERKGGSRITPLSLFLCLQLLPRRRCSFGFAGLSFSHDISTKACFSERTTSINERFPKRLAPNIS